jgi:cytoskeletal protein RodZ
MGRDIEKAIDDGASQTSKESDAPGETQRSDRNRTTCKRRWILGSLFLVIVLVTVAVVLGITLSQGNDNNESLQSSNAVAATDKESSQPKDDSPVEDIVEVPAEEKEDSNPAETSDKGNPSSVVDSTMAETDEDEKTKDTSNKKSWPELVGVPVEDAIAVISEERPDLEIETIPYDFMFTTDYDTSRVRIFTKAGLVFQTPVIG